MKDGHEAHLNLFELYFNRQLLPVAGEWHYEIKVDH